MKKNIFVLLFIFFLSLVSSFSLFLVSYNLFLPKIYFNNNLNFNISFDTDNESIKLYLYDENGNIAQNLEYKIKGANIEKSVDISIPFINSHKIGIIFGDNHTIARISKFSINSKSIDLNLFAKSAQKQNHVVGFDKNSSSIYIKSNEVNDPIYLNDLNAEIFCLTSNELKELYDSDNFLYISYYFLLFSSFFFILLFLWKRELGNITNRFLVIISYLLGFILLCANYNQNLSYISSIDNANFQLNLFKYLQNNIPVFVALFGFYYLIFILKSKLARINFFVLFLITYALLLIDSGVYQSLGVRYIFRLTGEYLLDYDTAVSFILSYLSSISGMLYISVFLLSVSSFAILGHQYTINQTKVDKISLFTVISLLLIIFIPLKESKNDFYFANVFQINGFSFKTLGDYSKPYSDNYKLAQNLDLQWEEKTGLNKQQNVIILLVESLNCELTTICGNSDLELMPNLAIISKEYLLFDNYYSNNYSTSTAYLTITKGLPIFPPKTRSFISLNPYLSKIFDINDLPGIFKKNDYTTKFFSSTDLVFEMDRYVAFSQYDEVIDSKHDLFKNFEKNFLFNSVNDEVLLQQIALSAKNETKKFYYITKTASSHAPFVSPWGENDFEKSFKYTDYAINKFIETLENNGYFDNGILIITGDHRPWSYSTTENFDDSVMKKNNVPLIIIGKDFKGKNNINHTYFSHSSLGIYIQSIMFEKYFKNKFQTDPLYVTDPEVILYYHFAKQHFAIVKINDIESEIKINSDESEFLDNVLSLELQNDILGFLACVHL